NTIYHNNFIANNGGGIQAYDDDANTWNLSYPSGGNYWSDWTTPDVNADGFVDTPYPFITGGTNQDNWPHTTPNGWNNPHPEQYVLNVDQGLWYETIQSAVDAATPDDTIWASARTYNENVIVDKSLTLEGEDMTTTIIDGGGAGDVVYINADWVNMTGFTVTKSGSNFDDAGIELNDVQNCRIENNNANNNAFGIYLYASNNNTITHNNANNNTYGIYLHTACNNTITHNAVNNNTWDGIWLESSSENTIANNTSNNNDYGIGLSSASNSNTVYHNNIINNTNQAYDSGTNTWNLPYPSGGNYWSDWTIPDVNADGFVDTPYPFIAGGATQDMWPHTEPYGWLDEHPNQNVLNVDLGLWWPTIQGTIDNASAGHTIWVSTGTYDENVVMDKVLTLQGEDRDVTIIDGGGVGSVVYISADWVNMTGFTVRDSGPVGFPHVNAGIELDGVQYCNISDNKAMSSDMGIWLSNSENNIITNNLVTGNYYGIILDYSRGSTIVDNRVIFNDWNSISLSYSNDSLVANNIAGNTLMGVTGTGISVSYSNNVTITSNDANNNTGSGISLWASHNNTIRDNTANNNNNGIRLRNSMNNTIENNTANNNDNGIILYTSHNNNVTNNNVNMNIDSGIFIIFSSQINLIDGNEIHSNGNGVYFRDSNSNNTISNNSISMSTSYGFYSDFSASFNNSIYHNNIISNAIQAYSVGNNTWNLPYPSGGNYWSDWTIPDVNADGFVDTPYPNIAGGANQDMWPHTVPNGWNNPHPEQYVLNTDQGLWYETIQSAVNTATPDDIIWASARTYNENVVVDKSLTLEGEDMATTIIDGGGVGNVVNISADMVNLIGFTIQNGGGGTTDSGVLFYEASNSSMLGCLVRDQCDGVYLLRSRDITLFNNNVSGSLVYGFYIHYSNWTKLEHNDLWSNGQSILAHYSNNNVIHNTSAVGNGFGITLWHANDNIVRDNVEMNTTVGVMLDTSHNNHINNNTIIQTSMYGICTTDSNFNEIWYNDITNCDEGLRMYRADYNNIYYNTVNDAQTGTLYWLSQHNMFVANDLDTSSQHGLYLIWYSSENDFIDNTIGNCSGNGIYLLNLCDDNTFTDNIIANNENGTVLSYSNTNTFYHNHFISNTNQSWDNGTNTWNLGYPQGGNYWSDWTTP
ncbi:MAG: right-handed parallel beta-helix repeat-containing protein, partial [Thermoplasmata archaeon]|nr:right-handed parallel beta-helix repeat-containing protein [Thermoplasmata archaeon]